MNALDLLNELIKKINAEVNEWRETNGDTDFTAVIGDDMIDALQEAADEIKENGGHHVIFDYLLNEDNLKAMLDTPNLLSKLEESYYNVRDNGAYRDDLLFAVDAAGKEAVKESTTKRLYVDMDGVLAEFNPDIESEEVLMQEGYYNNLPPQKNVVEAIRDIAKNDKEIEVYILSAVLPSPYAKNEKWEWLDKYLPEIDARHRLFVPYGESKQGFIGRQLGKNDTLLDDYSKNLHEWCPSGNAIKLKNGINGRFGTWTGATVSCFDPPQKIARDVRAFALQERKAPEKRKNDYER